MELNDFLFWLVSGGGAIIAVSWIAERVPWFQAQASKVKEMLFFGASTVVSLGAYAVITYVPADALEAASAWFYIIAGTFIATYLGSGFHSLDKK